MVLDAGTHVCGLATHKTPPPNRCRAMTQSTRQRRESSDQRPASGRVEGDVVDRSCGVGRWFIAPPAILDCEPRENDQEGALRFELVGTMRGVDRLGYQHHHDGDFLESGQLPVCP
jgi:hypothetical protein